MHQREPYSGPHPYMSDGWGPSARADVPASARVLPDINPGETVYKRLRSRLQNAMLAGGPKDGLSGEDGDNGATGEDGTGLDGKAGLSGSTGAASQAATLASRVGSLEKAMKNASIAAACNGDGTITVTLTWG